MSTSSSSSDEALHNYEVQMAYLRGMLVEISQQSGTASSNEVQYEVQKLKGMLACFSQQVASKQIEDSQETAKKSPANVKQVRIDMKMEKDNVNKYLTSKMIKINPKIYLN